MIWLLLMSGLTVQLGVDVSWVQIPDADKELRP